MKFFTISILIPTAITLFSAVIEDFTIQKNYILTKPEQRQQKLEMSPAEDGTQKISFQFDNAKKAPAMEMNLQWTKRKKLQSFPATLRLTVSYTEPAAFSRIALRVCDAQDEFFHFPPVKQFKEKDGRLVLTYQIREKGFSSNWGRKVNGKFDFPIQYCGLAVDFNKRVPSGGITFEKLDEVSFNSAEISVEEQLMSFEEGRDRYPVSAVNGTGKAKMQENQLNLAGTASSVTVTPYQWKQKERPFPESLLVNLNAGKGAGILEITFKDASGKLHTVSSPWTQTGGQQLKLSVPAGGTGKVIYRDFKLKFPDRQKYEITLSGIKQTARLNRAEVLKTEIRTGNPLHILKTGTEKDLKLEFANPSGRTLNWNITSQFRDFSGKGFDRKFPLSLAPGEKKQIPVTGKLNSKGIWYVRTLAQSAEKPEEQSEQVRTFAYMDAQPETPLSPKNTFLFGMNAHLFFLPEKEYGLAVEAMKFAGVKLLRIDAFWDSIQPAENTWNFQRMDKLVGDMQKNGITLNVILHPNPRWAAPPEHRKNYWDWSRCRPRPGAYRTFAQKMAERYRGKVSFWEIWNEADLICKSIITDREYAEVLKEGAEGIRKGDHGAWIATCGFASISHPRSQKNFQRNVLRDAKGFYDIHAFHQHGGFPEFASVIDNEFLPMRKELGVTEPWFANETALTSAGGTERVQAITVFKKILFAWSRGSVSYNWYNLRNKGIEPFNGEHNYGIFTYDFHPKAAFSAFAEMSRIYTGAKFEKQWNLLPGQFILQFRKPGKIILGAWNEAADVPSVPMLFKTDAKSAAVIDLMGNRTEIPLNNGLAVFPVSAVPSSLILENAAKAEADGSLIRLNAPGAIVPGKVQNCSVSVRNPFPVPAKLEMNLRAPKGVQLKQTGLQREIPPSGQVEIPFALIPGTSFRKEAAMTADYKLNSLAGSLRIPLHPAKPILFGTRENRAPDFVIDSAEHVHNLYQADPQTEYRTWKGPKDLSAKIWLGRGKNSLKLKLIVEDDRHVQPYTGANVYLGDNVQLALQLPGQTGVWEIGLSHRDDGKPEVFIWITPSGFSAEKSGKAISLKTARKGTQTFYDAEIPFSAIGLSQASAKNGFRFNLLVNENDGEGRDGWIFLAPGLGISKSPEKYPFLVLE